MSTKTPAACTAEELAVLGETFGILATKAAALAELLLRSSPQHDTEAAEALARQIGAIADAAAEWSGAGLWVGGIRGGLMAQWFLPEKLLQLATHRAACDGQVGGAA